MRFQYPPAVLGHTMFHPHERDAFFTQLEMGTIRMPYGAAVSHASSARGYSEEVLQRDCATLMAGELNRRLQERKEEFQVNADYVEGTTSFMQAYEAARHNQSLPFRPWPMGRPEGCKLQCVQDAILEELLDASAPMQRAALGDGKRFARR